MINPKVKLSEHIFDKSNLEFLPTRDGYGRGLVAAGEKDERVVVLCADLTESTRSQWFKDKFPDRFIELGVAEQNMATIAAGLANYGKIPFMSSYATFSPGRNNEQIRTTISLNNLPVKIAGSHAGVSVGPDGATHQALEDIALMRAQPRMVVLCPCDAIEAQKATVAAAAHPSPVYIRLGREKSPVITTLDTPFAIGKAHIFYQSENPQVTLIACGILIHHTLLAAQALEKESIGSIVINSPSIKPLDVDTIVAAAQKTGAVVTIEEHQIAAGFGSAIAECLAQSHPVPQEFVGVHDRFGESGNAWELIDKLGMSVQDILESAKKVLRRKT